MRLVSLALLATMALSIATTAIALAQPRDPVDYWMAEAERRAESIGGRTADMATEIERATLRDAEIEQWLDEAAARTEAVEKRASGPAELERTGAGILGAVGDWLPWLAPLLPIAGVGVGAAVGRRSERRKLTGTTDPVRAALSAVLPMPSSPPRPDTTAPVRANHATHEAELRGRTHTGNGHHPHSHAHRPANQSGAYSVTPQMIEAMTATASGNEN